MYVFFSQDFGAKAFCTALESEAKGIEIISNNHFAFSLFGKVSQTLFTFSFMIYGIYLKN